jgi:uncharacterized metal-binding protein
MASGKTHDVVTYALLVPLFAVGTFVLGFHPIFTGLFVVGVWLGGIFLSPDLDTKSRPFYRWGVLRFIWTPYQWMAPHRSWLSHGIVIGPVLRVLYVGSLGVIAYTLVRLGWICVTGVSTDLASRGLEVVRYEVASIWSDYGFYLGLFLAGAWVGSLLHVGLDALSTWRRTGRPSVYRFKRKP